MIPCADGFEQADFLAALHDGGCDQVGNAQRRTDEAQGCDQDHEQLGLIQNGAFAFGHLPNGACDRAGNDLLNLIADSADVGRAVPGFIVPGGQGGWVSGRPAGQLVIRGGEGGNLNGSHLVFPVGHRLNQIQRGKDLLVLVAARVINANDGNVLFPVGSGNAHRVSRVPSHFLRKQRSRHDLRSHVAVLFIQPAAFGHVPPGTHPHHARVQAFAGRQIEVMVEPGARHFHV